MVPLPDLLRNGCKMWPILSLERGFAPRSRRPPPPYYGYATLPEARLRITPDPRPSLFQDWRCRAHLRSGNLRSAFLGIAVSAAQAQQERNGTTALSPPRRGTCA